MRFPPTLTRRLLCVGTVPLLTAYFFSRAGIPARVHDPTSARADTLGTLDRLGLAGSSRAGELGRAIRLQFQGELNVPDQVMVQYTLKNPFPDREIAFSIRTAPHAFGEITLTRDGERLPLKEKPLRLISVGNFIFLAPDEDYSATARIEEFFDLTKPGTYKVRLKKTVDVLTLAKINTGSCVVASNELTFVVPGP